MNAILLRDFNIINLWPVFHFQWKHGDRKIKWKNNRARCSLQRQLQQFILHSRSIQIFANFIHLSGYIVKSISACRKEQCNSSQISAEIKWTRKKIITSKTITLSVLHWRRGIIAYKYEFYLHPILLHGTSGYILTLLFIIASNNETIMRSV